MPRVVTGSRCPVPLTLQLVRQPGRTVFRSAVSTGSVPTGSQGHHGPQHIPLPQSSPVLGQLRCHSRNRCGPGYRNVLGHVWGCFSETVSPGLKLDRCPARPMPPSSPGSGVERVQRDFQRALHLRAGVQGPAVTHTRGPWSGRRGASSQQTGPDLGPRLLVRATLSSGESPRAHLRLLCPFCSFSHTCHVHGLLCPLRCPLSPAPPRARPLHTVPAASQTRPRCAGSASPRPVCWVPGKARGGARTELSVPTPSAEPCVPYQS